jgi:glycerate dehydrogenase
MRIAVLDDYHNFGPEYLCPLLGSADAGSRVQISFFRDTLTQDTPAEVAALAARLAPFEVICTMRERTPFSAALLARLPRLRFLLTTGTHNRALDIEAAAARGIVVAGTAPTAFRWVINSGNAGVLSMIDTVKLCTV